MMSLFHVVSGLILISLSSFLSASEVALFSLSKFQLRFLKDNFRPLHRKIKFLLSDPGGLLTTILVGNEFLNICLSILVTETLSQNKVKIPSEYLSAAPWVHTTFLGLFVTTPLVLLFCDITPKIIALKINQFTSMIVVGPLFLFYKAFTPFRFFLSRLSRLIFSSIESVGDEAVKEADVLFLAEEGHKEGQIHANELDLIHKVFELDHTEVNDASTPISQVISVSMGESITGALVALKNSRYSRIPVFGKTKKDIVGILYAKDLLRAKLQREAQVGSVSEIMRKPLFINAQMKLSQLFRRFKQHKTHMAIIRGGDGQALGVITMSDLLEVLFEDFFQEPVQVVRGSTLD